MDLKSRRLLAPLTLLLAFLLGACNNHSGETTQFQQLPAEGWAYGDTVTFCLDSTTVGTPSVLNVALRHSNYYEYRNLWLEISYRPPHLNADARRDTVNIDMADVYGRWHGHGLGASFQISVTVDSQYTALPDAAINIRHVMRVDTLKGIEMVGFSLKPL